MTREPRLQGHDSQRRVSSAHTQRIPDRRSRHDRRTSVNSLGAGRCTSRCRLLHKHEPGIELRSLLAMAQVTADDITLSITTLNRPVQLQKTLQGAKQGPSTQVIINGGDASPYTDYLKASPDLRLIVNRKNLGVTGSWNQGIVMSNTRFVVLSGDDLRFDSAWLQSLIERLNQGPAPTTISLSEPTRYSAFCIDKSTIPEMGWFDHNFSRVYYEDEDWFLRTQEHLGINNMRDAFSRLPERLDVVHRRPHAMASWNSIPNRLYFWRKWQRLAEESTDSFYLRPDIIVRRQRSEPVWPSLDALAHRYRLDDFSASEFTFDQPALVTRFLTLATSNRLFINLRKKIQARTNPEGVLRW